MTARGLALITIAVLLGPGTANAATVTSCRTCHVADRPVHGNADLLECPRTMARGAHAVDEGPKEIRMNDPGRHYGPVRFLHQQHAAMAEMGQGCSVCHHEATEGEAMRVCGECHPESRERVELDRPDRLGAVHRQCLTCHRRWDPGGRCRSCHEGADGSTPERREPVQKPRRLVYETGFTNGVLATFYHDDHAERFALACVQCHADQACEDCHDRRRTAKEADRMIKCTRMGTEAHATCSGCHDVDQECASCHRDAPMDPFEHQHTGLALNDDHADADCTDCHVTGDFKKPPSCRECHDEDISFPNKLPGIRIVPAVAGPKGAPS